MNLLLKSLALSIQRIANGYDPLAKGNDLHFANSNIYPIFIVGAPRTGSTLLYQLLIEHTQLIFISNLMALLPRKMILIAYLTHYWMQRVDVMRANHYGYIPGLFSPNEAGAIMRKWFEQSVGEQEKKFIRNSVIQLSNTFNVPFINKNLMNSLRLDNLYKILPETRFIFIRRHPMFTAQSIILARRKGLGDEQAWLGPKPFGFQEVLERDVLYQAIWQVKKVEEIIETFLYRVEPIYLEITYEVLCQDLINTLNRISEYFDLEYKSEPLLGRLLVREEIRLPQTEWQQLEWYYAMLYSDIK